MRQERFLGSLERPYVSCKGQKRQSSNGFPVLVKSSPHVDEVSASNLPVFPYLLPGATRGYALTMTKKRTQLDLDRLSDEYRRVRLLEGRLARQPVRCVTRPGFPDWNLIPPAMDLLARNAPLQEHTRVLLLPCGHGALGAWIAERYPDVDLALRDTNVIAVDMAQRTMALTQLACRCAAHLPDERGYDAVLMVAPKGRAYAKLLMLAAHRALVIGGALYIAGPKAGGIKSTLRDAEVLLGSPLATAYGGGNRFAMFRKAGALAGLPPEYAEPGIAPATYRRFTIGVGGACHIAATRPGVFSWRKLDEGAKLLLETLDPGDCAEVADVGCGYGIIGLHLAGRLPGARLTLIDVDTLACECARETMRVNGVGTARVLAGDGLGAVGGERFSLVISNPPFHAGHRVNLMAAHAIVAEAHRSLTEQGALAIVANRFLAYDRVIQHIFGNVTVLAETPQYRVLHARRS